MLELNPSNILGDVTTVIVVVMAVVMIVVVVMVMVMVVVVAVVMVMVVVVVLSGFFWSIPIPFALKRFDIKRWWMTEK